MRELLKKRTFIEKTELFSEELRGKCVQYFHFMLNAHILLLES